MIEYYTERMTKDWNQERYTVRKYHKWTKRPRNKFNKKQTKYQAKMNTQLMAEKKTKNYATKKTYLQFMAENRITLQWQKKTLLTTYGGKLLKKKTELRLITYSSAKE